MANTVSYFYYAPTWDLPPEGPIKLGNVLTSVKKPDQPLHTAPPPITDEVFSSEKKKVEYSKENLKAGGFSILTKFLSIFGVGVDLGVSWKTSDCEVYSFDRVETTQFVPKDDYIQKCVEAPAVRRHLERSRYRKPVYVITGIKTVYGAAAKSYRSRGHGHQVGIAVDGTIWSNGVAPISLEPEVAAMTETAKATAWEGSSDFVFAFRVRKIRVNKKTGAVKTHEDFTRDAFMADSESENDEGPELVIVSQGDPKPEKEGYSEEQLMEGGIPVNCAIPKAEAGNEE